MMQHYNNGDQIVTDEPCLNCTCRDNMLMCFLKVCPYVMPLTKGCTMEKKPGDCCATVTCEQGQYLELTDLTDRVPGPYVSLAASLDP